MIIGKQNQSDKRQMEPNENFLKYLPEVDLPEERYDSNRSSCLRIGAYIIIQQMMKETGIPELLSEYFNDRDLGLFLDLITYTLICENNAGQYYPDYAYNHPLFTEGMRIYSDATVSGFFGRVTDDQSIGFLNEWNAKRDHREKIYISYDSTNKNIQAGDVEIAEFGNAKVDTGKPIFNYSIAYDTHNQEPLFYEKYPGSINDVSQLQIMLDKAMGYGYRKIGFILDRGYFSKANLDYMDHCGYDFVVNGAVAEYRYIRQDEDSGEEYHETHLQCDSDVQITGGNPVSAVAGIPINEAHFEDKNFRDYLTANYDGIFGDGAKGVLSPREIYMVSDIDLHKFTGDEERPYEVSLATRLSQLPKEQDTELYEELLGRFISLDEAVETVQGQIKDFLRRRKSTVALKAFLGWLEEKQQ